MQTKFLMRKGVNNIIPGQLNTTVFAQGLGLLAQLLCSRLTKSILISKLVCTYVVSFCTLSYQNFFCAYSFSEL